VCKEPTLHMNMFHQYHIDYGHPLDMEAYCRMARYCAVYTRVFFFLEILTVMVHRHKIRPPIWVRRKGQVWGVG